jgi:hypothetical protein
VVAVADAFTVRMSSGDNTLDVLANDLNRNTGTTLSLINAKGALNGVVRVSGRSVLYTPNVGFVGTDTFTYQIFNSWGFSSTGTATVTVVR